ncbi:MAG: Ig-like domain-containing protein, partial [Monoglobaceae bacterium]
DKLLISLPPEGWYTFESIVDLDNTTHEVTAYNANGAQVGHMKLDELGIRTGGVNDQGVSGIMFRQWEAGGTIYVDDVKMEYCVETPQISDNSVAFIDADGSEVTDLQNVPASTKKISIDFGCEVVGSSVEGNITVTDGSDSIPYTYTVEDTKVVLTLSSFMKPNTDYTLKIGKGISSSDNIALGTDYDIRFTTGEAVKSAGIGSVKIDDAEFTALTQLYNGAVIKVSTDYVNTTEDNMSFVWIVAYYDANDRLLSIQIQEANSVAGGASIPVKEFTVDDIDGIAEVDVYLWNSVIGMIPYGNRYAVDKNGIVE